MIANLRFAAAKINKKRTHQTCLIMERKREVDTPSQQALIDSGRADCAWSVAESAICSKRLPPTTPMFLVNFIFAGINPYHHQQRDNGAGRFTIIANGKDPCTFFDRPASVGSKARIRFCLEALRFVGKEPTSKSGSL